MTLRVARPCLVGQITRSFSTGRTLKICTYNVNGIRAATRKGLGDYLEQYQPDIVCLQEIKATEEQNTLDVSAYKYRLWHPSGPPARKGYSGTAMFSKEAPKYYRTGLGDEDEDHEGRAITAVFDNFILLNTYVPNAGMQGLKTLPKRIHWNGMLSSYLKDLSIHGLPIIWTGDLNVAHTPKDVFDGDTNKARVKSAGFTPEERSHFSSVLDQGYVDVYRKLYPKERGYSFYSALRKNAKTTGAGWRLDYFVVSPELVPHVRDITTHTETACSDHVPVTLSIAL